MAIVIVLKILNIRFQKEFYSTAERIYTRINKFINYELS